MYAYIYDSFTNDSRYSKLLYKAEKRLTDLGLNGKIIRLGVSKNIKVAVEDEIRQGTKTIIAVGNDRTVNQVLNCIVSNQSDEKHLVTLGIIPIAEKENKIAAAFGINSIADACEILLARRLENFRLAQLNQGFFLFQATISVPDTIMEIDKNYTIQNSKPTLIEISNSPIIDGENDYNRKLKLRISNKEGESLFSFKELLVINNSAPIVTDGALEVKTPARIRASAEQIKIIVGKQRNVK
jgi:hypothetical protein